MKKHLRKTAVFILICMTLALASTSGVAGRTAADINEEIRLAEARAARLEEENRQREQQIRAAQGDAAQLHQLRTLVERQIEGVRDRINELDGMIMLQQEAIAGKQFEIERLENRIADAELEVILREDKIVLLEAENEENLARFGQLVKNNYMTGTYGYLDILMKSGDFYDMIVRVDVLQKAAERNNEFMNNLLNTIREQEREIRELEVLKRQLDSDRITREAEKTELEIQLEKLNSDMDLLDAEMDAEQEKLRSYVGEIAGIQDNINSMFRRVNATNAEIEELERLTTQLIKERQNLDRPNFSGDGFIWPLEERFQRITDTFGWTSSFGGRNHGGIDIGNAGINGASIYSIQSGTVIRAVESNSNAGYGSHVIVDHGGGVASLYAHMQFGSVAVSEGQDVVVGQMLGRVGSTGWSTGPHLHFEIHVNGVRVNPLGYNYTFMY
jgi:murein DD-endopeptidase MepM/ murein hydrolase activator NlpD